MTELKTIIKYHLFYLKNPSPSHNSVLNINLLFAKLLLISIYQAWARREALAREKVVEAGGEIEFGKWYQSVQFEESEIDNMPVLKEE